MCPYVKPNPNMCSEEVLGGSSQHFSVWRESDILDTYVPLLDSAYLPLIHPKYLPTSLTLNFLLPKAIQQNNSAE